MEILITGGAGFIGSTLATALAEKRHQVLIYDTDACDARLDHIEYFKGTIFDAIRLKEAIDSCDTIIHMIGLADARIAQEYPQLSFDLNVRSMQIVLEAARNGNISRFIVPSSASIYGAVDRSPIAEDTPPKPTSTYSYHKFMAEKLAECYANSYGMNITVLRLFNVYGSQGKSILNILIDKARNREVANIYGEKQKRDFIHVSDVAEAFVRILDMDRNGYEVYNIGTGTGRSIEDIINLVKRYLPDVLIEYGNLDGILYDSIADITKIKKATGFDPDKSDRKLRYTIEKMIRS